MAAIAGATRAVVGYADSYTRLQNRLRTVIPQQDAVNRSLGQLFQIANRTRTPVESLVNLFQRGSIAASELGASNEELLLFVERVGQGLAVQGTSAAAASGALTQLSQALGSGIVRAEEFNSILEGAFPIAQAAARGIDRAAGSVAQLRTLIVNGQVTSREFFEGFLRGSEQLEEQFGRTTATIGQAFTVLSNNLTKFIGEADQGAGASKRFAEAILLLAENLDAAVRVIELLAEALLARFATRALAAAGAIGTFSAKAGALAITKTLVNPVTLGVAALEGLRDVLFQVNEALETSSSRLDAIAQQIRTLSPFGGLLPELGGIAGRAPAPPTRVARPQVGFAAPEIPPLLQPQSPVQEGLASIAKAFESARESALGFLSETERTVVVQTQLLAPLQAENEALAALAGGNRDLAQEIQLRTALQEAGIRATEEEIQSALALERANEQLRLQASIYEQVIGPQERFVEAQAAVNELVQKFPEHAGDLNAHLERIRIASLSTATSMEAGFERAFAKIRLEAMDMASVVEAAFGSLVDGAVNVLDDLVTTGGANFEQLAEDALRQIQRILIRALLLQAIAPLLGGGGAPGPTIPIPGLGGGLPGRQHGGRVQPGRAFLVGERGPEPFVPPTAGTVLPNEALAGLGQRPQLNVTIVNEQDPDMVKSFIGGGGADEVILNRLGANRSKAKAAIG